MSTTHEFRPDYATPPGFTLEETLEDLTMTQAELALRTGLSTKHINQIIQGHASLTLDSAMRLERATGVPARIWNNLESRYQEHRSRLAEEAALHEQLSFLDQLPISAMVSMGLLGKRTTKVERLREVFSFFGVADSDAWTATWSKSFASFRKSRAHESNDGAVSVWLRMGEIEATSVQTAPWDPNKFKEALSVARTLTTETDPTAWQPALVEVCAGAGVALVVVPEVKGGRTHGVARWLAPDRALIQLSIRYRWSDIFWFSFFHEAKHVLDEAKRSIYVEQSLPNEESRPDDEVAADAFAASFLIPPNEIPALRQIKTLLEVSDFANRLGVHPGIVVGRLQHEGVWPRSQGNQLRQRLVFAER